MVTDPEDDQSWDSTAYARAAWTSAMWMQRLKKRQVSWRQNSMENLCEQRSQLQEENTLVLEEKRQRKKEHTAALQHLPILQQSVLIKYSAHHPWEKLREKDC